MELSYASKIVVKSLKCYFLSVLLCFGILLILSLFVNCITLYFIGGIILLRPCLESFVGHCMPKEGISPDGKAICISGCDRGFGYMLAQRLDDIGFHVFAGCLFPEGDGASNLRKSGSQRLHVIGLDVTSDDSVAGAVAYIQRNLKGNVLWAIVNNAGISFLGEVPWVNMDEIERITDVNLLGVVRVTKAFLPMLKESKGKIVTVASLAGRVSVPGMVPYCMTKAAVISFCDGLRLELYKWGIQVITIEPSFYRTFIMDEDEATKITEKKWEKASKDVKDFYDSNYIKTFLKKMLFFWGFTARDPSEVICVMEDVITHLHPQQSYGPGSYVLRIASRIEERLPKPIGDILKLYTILGKDLM